MANMPDVNNVQRAIRPRRTLDAKIQKKYRHDNMTIKDAYILALEYATRNVALSANDHRRIADDIDKAIRMRKEKRV